MSSVAQYVEEELKNKDGISSSDAVASAKALTDVVEELIKKYGDNIGAYPDKLGIRNASNWLTPVDIAINYKEGDVMAKAIAKAVVSGMAGSYIAALAAAALSPVGATFVITIGTTLAVGYFAGNAVSSFVDWGYDQLIGPNFELTMKTNNSADIEVDYTTFDALTSNAGLWYGQSLYSEVKDLESWTLISTNINDTVKIEKFKGSHYGINITLKDAKKEDKDYVKALCDFSDFKEFNLDTTSDTNKEVKNLKLYSVDEIISLIKSNETELYYVANLKPYTINDNETLSVGTVGDEYYYDLANMAYQKLHLLPADANYINLMTDETYDNSTSKNRVVFGTNGDDENITGFLGNDRLYGGAGDDTLNGASGSDKLYGGTGTDTYIVDGDDIISDLDGEGSVIFKGKEIITLKEGIWNDEEKKFLGDEGFYQLNGNTLTYTNEDTGRSITIENYNKEEKSLGIELRVKDIKVTIEDVEVNESSGLATVKVSISEPLDDFIHLTCVLSDGTANSEDYEQGSRIVTILAGETEVSFDIKITDDDKEEDKESFNVKVISHTDVEDYLGHDLGNIDYGDGGKVYIKDDDQKKDIYVSMSDVTINEDDGSANITVSISETLNENLILRVATLPRSATVGDFIPISSRAIVIEAGTTETTFNVNINNDEKKEETETFTVEIKEHLPYSGEDLNNIDYGNASKITILDNDEEDENNNDNTPKPINPPFPIDPLVLDTNKDGYISTISVEDSDAYFDLTGDGIREKVSWVGKEDGILVYDRNQNNIIDGIDEVFGNGGTNIYEVGEVAFSNNLNALLNGRIIGTIDNTTLQDSLNGFEELKYVANSNNDTKIDRKDELYHQLKVWNDLNADGRVSDDELQTLHEAGIKSIDLDYINTNINLNGSNLSQAARYTDSEQNEELAADLTLEYNPILTTVDIEDIPDFTVDPITNDLPNLKGYGLFVDSFIAYNINEELKIKAVEFSQDIAKVATQFDEFIEIWSGYKAYIDGIKEKYNLQGDIDLPEIDKKTWIAERLVNTQVYTTRIEHDFEELCKEYTDKDISGVTVKTIVPDGDLSEYYNEYYHEEIIQRYEGAFALNAFYDFDDVNYESSTGRFLIDDSKKDNFNTQLIEYFNNESNPLEKKVYLSKALNMQKGKFISFEQDDFLSAILNNELKDLIAKTLSQDDRTIHVYEKNINLYQNNAVVIGSDDDEIIKLAGENTTVLAGKGDDVLISTTGDSKYIFRAGDGNDVIYDTQGLDTLVFDGISKENVSFSYKNEDLIISHGGDRVVIQDWVNSTNRIESIVFDNNEIISSNELVSQLMITEVSDYIEASSNRNVIDALGGDDTILGLEGNDTLIGNKGDDSLQGGSGDDTYIYNIGDGIDTIYDVSGNDSLNFGENITKDDLGIKFEGNDLVLALKEDGKTFDELANKVVIKDWKLLPTRVENINFTDGTTLGVMDLYLPTVENDNLIFNDEDITIDMLAGDDILKTGSGNDTVLGNLGNDTLVTKAGDDTLEGGAGNDILKGGLGNDTYIYNIGDDKDIIDDSYTYGYKNTLSKNAGEDTLKFGQGITKDNLQVQLSGDDIVIGIKEEGKSFDELKDTITIKNWLDSNSTIEHIHLDDGTYLKLQDLQQATQFDDTLIYDNSNITVDALAGNDHILTGNGDNNISGNEGEDLIETQSGKDILKGGAGNDILKSLSGDDILEGGKDNDILEGGRGDDIYIFNLGDGEDTIYDNHISQFMQIKINAGDDTIKFGEGITASDLVAKIKGDDVIIAIKEEGKTFEEYTDIITIKEGTNRNNRIENIKLFDGTNVSFESILQGTPENDYLVYGDNGVTIDALAGDDTVISGNGNDTIYGNSGNDIIKTYNGNDIIAGGVGNDTLFGGSGSDTYIFNLGDGKDTIYDSHTEYGKVDEKNDTIIFGEGITLDDLVAKIDGKEMILAIKEDDKTFDDYSDKIIIKNWSSERNRVENVKLADGTIVSLESLQQSTQNSDYLVFYNEANVNSLGGDDTVIANDANDIISGGRGNDILKGGDGNDTYIFNLGDGIDTITDTGGVDKISFRDNISNSDLIFRRNGSNLIIGIHEENKNFDELSDKITVNNWFKSDNNIESIDFNDGSSIDSATIAAYFVKDNVPGLIYSKPGAILFGEGGDDTYVYNKGDFTVTVDDQDFQDEIEVNAGNDKLVLSGGINKEDVIFTTFGNDLVINIIDEKDTYEELKDRVVIKDWQNQNRGIEEIVFSNGETLAVDKAQIYETDTTFKEEWYPVDHYVYGDTDNSVSHSGNVKVETNGGDDTITTSSGDDSLYGGDGDDTLISNNGKDFLDGGEGSDKLQGGKGNDTYFFGRGFGQDTITDEYFFYTTNQDAGIDTIRFQSGITLDDLIFQQKDADLIIGIKDGNTPFNKLEDKLIIKNWNDANYKIENFIFSDNSYITYEKVFELMDKSYDDYISTSEKASSATELLSLGFFNAINQIKVLSESGDDLTNVSIDLVGEVLNMENVNASDEIYGGEGNDIIITREGIDILDGGTGDDRLEGGRRNDIYIFGRGYGHDTILDISYFYGTETDGGNDIIKFKEGVTSNDLIFQQNNNDLIIGIKEDGKSFDELSDKLTIENWNDSNYSIENFIFSDNSTLTKTDIYSLMNTDKDDIITTSQDVDFEFYKFAGIFFNPDTTKSLIDTFNAHDTVYGGGGNDTISTGEGKDILSGGTGNDILKGGGHDDTYIFGRGYGQDTIFDEYFNYLGIQNAGNDSIKFDENLTVDDLIFKQKDNDLIIAVKEDGKAFDELSDKLTITNWNDTYYSIENFQFADGTTLSKEDIHNLMISNDDIISTGEHYQNRGADIISGGEGNDTITTRKGNDTLDGGSGNDVLKGGDNNDTYIFGKGYGNDNIVDVGISYGHNADGDTDTIKFKENIILDDLIFKQKDNDLIVAIKEDGKAFDELSDKLTITNWNDSFYTIENFAFSDGTSLVREDIHLIMDSSEDDIISTGAGNDYIFGGLGTDTIAAGKGDDTLYGGEGDDTFIQNIGHGQDTLIDNQGKSILSYGEGIVETDLSYRKFGNDLFISNTNNTDKTILKDWFNHNSDFELRFNDGSTVSQDQVLLKTVDENNETLNAQNIISSKENITIHGELGNDTYIYNKGDSTVIIDDSYKVDGIEVQSGHDRILFGDEITPTNITIQQYKNDLVLSIQYDDTNSTLQDYIVIKNWKNENQGIEEIVFSSGESIEIDKTKTYEETTLNENLLPINNHLYGYENNSFIGNNNNEVVYAEAGDDIVKTNNGNDILDGGIGNDQLEGGNGDDTYIFGKGYGNDTILDHRTNLWGTADAGNDTVKFKDLTFDELIFKQKNNDLVIAIKEDGKTFDELSDKLTITNWNDDYYSIENFIFSDASSLSKADIAEAMISPDDDVITMSDRNDTLDGGIGNDQLEGGNGDDTYIFGKGYGNDTILDYRTNIWGTADAGNDTVKFKDLTFDELIFKQKNNDLIIAIKEDGKTFDELSDKLTITNWNDDYYSIENFIFSDASSLSKADIAEAMISPDDDVITMSDRNDTLDGKTGNDQLEGGNGDDTYIFGKGYGNDTILDYRTNIWGTADAGNDTVKFKDLTFDELIFKQKNNDLIIAIKEDGKTFDELSDKLTITNWNDDYYSIENFIFSDASSLSKADIAEAMISPDDDVITMLDRNDIIYGKNGNDIINAGKGNDTLYGGEGDDTLYGNKGDDSVFGGLGTDTLIGSSGNDTLDGGEGDDIFIFENDHNQDVITDYEGKNILTFNSDITEDSIIFKKFSTDLFILDDNSTSNVVIKDWYNNNNEIEIKFKNGATLDTNYILDNVIDGNKEALDGQNTLLSKSNFILNGELGDDTYIFNKGDGIISINDQYNLDGSAVQAGNDKLQFNTDISLNDLIFEKYNDDLIIKVNYDANIDDSLQDIVIIKNWKSETQGIEKITFENGETLVIDKTVEYAETTFDTSLIPSNNYLYGYEDNVFNGTNNNEVIFTDAGNDTINSGLGDDILDGGIGDDILNGSKGDDTYIFARGYGQDTITDHHRHWSGNNAGNDTISFKGDITSDDLIFYQNNSDLIIAIKEDGKTFDELTDKITVKNWTDIYDTMENFVFEDGTSLTKTDVESLMISPNDDTINGSDSSEVHYGKAGNDTINSGLGDDILDGGIGDDILNGSKGDDTYIFARGYGQDTITDNYRHWSGNNAGNDTISFKGDITSDDLIFYQNNSDLIIAIKEDGKTFDELTDKITVKNWTDIYDTMENFVFEDGTSLTKTDVESLMISPNDDTINGSDSSEVHYGKAGNDTINSGLGDDILDGGIGDDILNGSKGDDTYIFARGYGQDTITDHHRHWSGNNAGNDTISFKGDITSDDLIFYQNNSDLIIAIKEDGKTFDELTDKITVKNWTDTNDRIENIKFSDGSILTFTDDDANYTITQPTQSTPPIVLDMNMNGITSTSLEDSNAYFDYAGDGQREHTSWIENGDALLVADLNNDGIVNDGSELFGNYTKVADGTLASDGYEALTQYDTNNDDIIDYKDSNFSKLSLWSDTNQNGKTDLGELINIQLSNVTAIHLTNGSNTVFEQVTENGNLITNETIYETNAQNGIVRDIWFEYDESDFITDNDTLQASDTLKYLNLGEGDDTYIYSLGDGKVTIDDNGNGKDTLKFTQGIEKEQIEVRWNKGSDDLILAIRPSLYDTTAVTQLENQILIKGWFKDSGSIETIKFDNGTSLNKEELFDILTSKKDSSAIMTRVLNKNGQLEGGDYNDLLYGTTGAELLKGNAGDDYLKGLEGDDRLEGGEGDDTHFAGLGDDIQTDISGDEYYMYNKGDGQDVIIDAQGNDTIAFGTGITLEDLEIQYKNEDLIIALKEDGKTFDELSDTITISNYTDDNFKIENIEFNNGNTVNIEEYLNSTTDTEIQINDLELNLQEDNNLSGSLDVLGNIDGIKYSIETSLENSNLLIDENGNYSYTPNANYNGTDEILVKVTNEYGETSTATLTFNIEAVNDTPVANADTATVAENATLTINASEILSNDTDVDANDILSITKVIAPSNKGIASLDSNGNVVFKAGNDFDYLAIGETEEVILSYEIQDDKGAKATSTISLTITGANDTPIIESIDSINTLEDSGILTGQVLASDVDNNASLVYSTTETIAGFTLNEDGSYSFDPSNEQYQSLSEGDKLSITIPVTVTDENGATDSKDLVINILGTNDTPIANEDSATVQENSTLTISASDILSNDTDVDANDILSISNISAPANKGSVSLDSNGNVVFETGTDFDYLAIGETEEVILSYEIQDDKGAKATSTISLTITGANDTPIIESIDSINTLEDSGILTGQVLASDVDNNASLVYSTTETIAGFTLNEDGSYSFDPSNEQYQSLSEGDKLSITIPVTVTDENGATDSKDLVINILGTNDTPIANEDSATVQENATLTISANDILSNDSDVDANDILSISNITAPANKGSVSLDSNGNVVFKAGNDFDYLAIGETEEVILSYEIQDDKGAKATSTISLTITGANDTPLVMAEIEELVLKQELTKEGQIQAVDIDGDTLNYSILSDVEHGTLIVDEKEGKWIYNVDSTYSGNDSATILIDDGNGGTTTKTLNFDVQNDPINGDNNFDILFGNNDSNIMNGLGGKDYMFAFGGDDIMFGGSGNDKIFGHSGNDMLFGEEDNDIINGYTGDDTISGGTGNDYLNGSYGNDTYLFELGDGNDTIIEYESFNANNIDTILFGQGITYDNLKFIRQKNTLTIYVNENDSIKIKNWYSNFNNHKIENLVFEDGTILTALDVEKNAIIEGSSRKDYLYGSNSDDKLYGLEGNDRIYAYSGNDLLVGGKGNDYLKGGNGDDIYKFSKGDGNDIINDNINWFFNNSDSGNDTILFDEGIESTDILFSMHRNNLIVNYSEHDSIKIKYQNSNNSKIENFQLSDGSYLSSSDVETLIQNMIAFADENSIDLTNENEVRNNTELMNIVSNAWNQAS